MTETAQESNFVSWARTELQRAGLFDKDSDYEGMMGDEVMRLVETFDQGGHSGFSAHMALEIFSRLASWKPLTPLTDDPSEWMHIEENVAGDAITWQNRRRPDAFSKDGGKTYYCLDDPENYRAGTAADIDPDSGSDESPERVQKPRDQWVFHTSAAA